MVKKTIFIDGTEGNEKLRVGVSEYAYNLLNALYRIHNQGKSRFNYRILLKQGEINGLPNEKNGWVYEKLESDRAWLFTKVVPRLLKAPKADLFFSPTHYLPIFTNIPQVMVVHDLGYLMFSGQFRKYDFWQLKYWTAISIFISKYIISVSNSAKKDIVRHYGFASEKIKTIYHGIDHGIFNNKIGEDVVRRVKKKYKISKNYILYFGTLKPSKNIEGIIAAFYLFLKKHPKFADSYQLVISGKKGWLYNDIFKLVMDRKLQNRVIFTDYVVSEDKPAIMRGARLLISPSYWEGFGMHVLESMACGTPVVVSDRGSLKEVAGDAGIYVNPNDTKSISEGIGRVVLMDDFKYNKLSSLCEAQSKEFSWDETAKETEEVFRKVLNI